MGEDWGGVYHPNQLEDQWESHSCSDSYYRWDKGKETWVWWPPSATTIKPKLRPLMHCLPYINVTYQSQAWFVVRRYTNTSYIPWETSLFLYLDMSTLSGALLLPNSHCTGFVYVGYSLSLRSRWSCLMKKERWGWKCTPIPKRFCGKVQKRNSTSLIWFCCWSLLWPFIYA